MQVAIDAQHQLLVTKFSGATRGFEQKLLQCHEEVQVNVVKFHNHSLISAMPLSRDSDGIFPI